MKAIALILWMLLFGRGAPEANGESTQEQASTQEEKRSTQEEKRSTQKKRSAQATRTLQVPWPMVCNFIVRVIDGPADTAVVVAKRDCPD